DDLAAAHLLALEYAQASVHSIYNLGSGTGFSVREVIDACRTVTGHPIPTTIAPRRDGDPAVLIASSEAAVTDLSWRPQFTDITKIVGDAWRFTQSRQPV
ncbi:MAG TPA: UDP-glucose 4-epimerase GalE, partial [Pseudonocardia sp.]